MKPHFPVATRAVLAIGVVTIAFAGNTPALAEQSLIPTPYPNAVPGAAPLDPEPQGRGGPQEIIRDPYPQILGANAQGNPPISRRYRHQRLVPSIYQRKYRVDHQ